MARSPVPWKMLGEPLPLNAPPCLESFNSFCWRRFLTVHGVYVTVSRKGVWSRRGYTVYFCCISHKGCACQYRVRLSSDSVIFWERGDREHRGLDRKILGLTSQQWRVLELTKPLGVRKAVQLFKQHGVPCPSARLLRSKVCRPREGGRNGVGTEQFLCSIGGLTGYLHSRSREVLQARSLLKPGTCVCMRYEGVDPLTGKVFMAAFTQERWIRRCARLHRDMVGLNVYADGKHKHTRRLRLYTLRELHSGTMFGVGV